MKTFTTILLTLIVISLNAYAKEAKIEKSNNFLCSPEGLMSVIPELKSKEGKLQIPDPTKNLSEFYKVHNKLSNLILAELTKAYIKMSPSEIGDSIYNTPLVLDKKWRSAEIGIATNGNKIYFPDSGNFASFGGTSFMNNIEIIPNTNKSLYAITSPEGNKPAIVSLQPTVLPCVNNLDLAAANTAGIWSSPSYALGDTTGHAYMVVNKCIDLSKPKLIDGNIVATPDAEIFIAIQWADTEKMSHMRTKTKGHRH